MKSINVGIIGFGTVGSGVVRILREKRSLLAEKTGMEINIKSICDKDITSKRNVAVERSLLTRDPRRIIDDPQIDILVELVGGLEPAAGYISEALNKGKNIVTANKALLAQQGQRLFTLSRDRGKSIYFEASVGAGIPIIKALREGLVANRFNSVVGILNGTSNFILSKMSADNRSFAQALQEAKDKGFAEKDPSLDIDGIDSAHKLILLAYLCFGRFIDLKDVYIEGISRISSADISYAKELGFEIKLLAVVRREADALEARVHPALIGRQNLLASVGGVNNAICVSCDLVGDLLFYGPGAGQLSAASAIVADIVDLTQDIRAGLFRPAFNIVADRSIKKICAADEFESRYYIHFTAVDRPGVLAKISGVLAKYGISIASVTQKERKKARVVPIVMVIHQARERELRAALKAIDKMDGIKEKSVAIRIEDI